MVLGRAAFRDGSGRRRPGSGLGPGLRPGCRHQGGCEAARHGATAAQGSAGRRARGAGPARGRRDEDAFETQTHGDGLFAGGGTAEAGRGEAVPQGHGGEGRQPGMAQMPRNERAQQHHQNGDEAVVGCLTRGRVRAGLHGNIYGTFGAELSRTICLGGAHLGYRSRKLDASGRRTMCCSLTKRVSYS